MIVQVNLEVTEKSIGVEEKKASRPHQKKHAQLKF